MITETLLLTIFEDKIRQKIVDRY